jgi:4-hydroxybenzoate polyprenyltransferase
MPLGYFLFFYPFAMAHLGVNDLIDVVNDKVKGLKTVPVLYGTKRTVHWVLLFTAVHYATAVLFLRVLGAIALTGFAVGFVLLAAANYILLKKGSPEAGLKVLPLFHVTMLVYAGSIMLDSL